MVACRLNRISLWLLPCAGLIGDVSGFASVGSGRRSIRAPLALPSTTSDDTSVSNSLAGVAEFEEWFSSSASSGAQVNSIRHALFKSMGRGLQFTSTKSSDLSKVAVVPRKIVLHVPFSDDEESSSGLSWDSDLSCKLWQECQKGKNSVYYG